VTASRRPTRATVEGRAYLDLQNLARRQQRPTDELHQLYAIEGFLARLTRSPHADRLVLKGGVLLAAYDARRPTRDVDIQARAMAISGRGPDYFIALGVAFDGCLGRPRRALDARGARPSTHHDQPERQHFE
jgi:Nucleotidyl transferase AbiEii toxin, Type IV TA system